jgi:hypothetical protein
MLRVTFGNKSNLDSSRNTVILELVFGEAYRRVKGGSKGVEHPNLGEIIA